jgi:hypothetical protein
MAQNVKTMGINSGDMGINRGLELVAGYLMLDLFSL